MGGKEAALTAQRLLASGYQPDLPVVVIENCSRPNERILRLQLKELEDGLSDCEGPVLVMIGEAMKSRSSQT